MRVNQTAIAALVLKLQITQAQAFVLMHLYQAEKPVHIERLRHAAGAKTQGVMWVHLSSLRSRLASGMPYGKDGFYTLCPTGRVIVRDALAAAAADLAIWAATASERAA